MPDPTAWNTMPEDAFRAHLRDFIQHNCPSELRHLGHRLPASRTRDWYRALHLAGLIAPGWPVEHGGMGLTPARHLAYIDEMDAAGTPFLHDSGVRNLGPALIAYGTDAQKARYLPAMHAGDEIWCQGYSEPSAGSDLAGLSCSGRIEGDRMVVNGQKIWTTSAAEATHMFALVRTDRSAAKHAGITFVLIDMATPGITVRPIRNLAGHSDFCEVFFDDVVVRMDDVLGTPGDGWRVARAQLGFERIWAGSPKRAVRAVAQLQALMVARGLHEDPVWTDRLAQAAFDTLDAQDLYTRFADMVGAGDAVGVEVSALKIWSTGVYQAVTELLLDAAAEDGALDAPFHADGQTLDVLGLYHDARAPAIFAGTNEIHRNILARRVLNLPRTT